MTRGFLSKPQDHFAAAPQKPAAFLAPDAGHTRGHTHCLQDNFEAFCSLMFDSSASHMPDHKLFSEALDATQAEQAKCKASAVNNLFRVGLNNFNNTRSGKVKQHCSS